MIEEFTCGDAAEKLNAGAGAAAVKLNAGFGAALWSLAEPN